MEFEDTYPVEVNFRGGGTLLLFMAGGSMRIMENGVLKIEFVSNFDDDSTVFDRRENCFLLTISGKTVEAFNKVRGYKETWEFHKIPDAFSSSLAEITSKNKVAKEKKRGDVERETAEEKKRRELAKKAAEEKKRRELAKKAAEEKKRRELVKKAAEEKKRRELAKKAAEEKKRRELAKKAAEEKKRQELAKKAAEEKKRRELAKKAAEEKKLGVSEEGS